MTKEAKKYFKVFGVQATIEQLSQVSTYKPDEIWLWSVELLAEKVVQFNMKADAEAKESKAQYERMILEHEAKNPKK